MKKSELRKIIKEELNEEILHEKNIEPGKPFSIRIGDSVLVDHPRLRSPFKSKVTRIIRDKSKGLFLYSLGKDGIWDANFVEGV